MILGHFGEAFRGRGLPLEPQVGTMGRRWGTIDTISAGFLLFKKGDEILKRLWVPPGAKKE